MGKFLSFFFSNDATKVIIMCKLKTAVDIVVLASSSVHKTTVCNKIFEYPLLLKPGTVSILYEPQNVHYKLT